MCTVTFIPRPTGYYLAMNRDERLSRPVAFAPQRRKVGERTVICPTEPGGGTWIALNDSGVCLALINWYSVPRRLTGETVTRGRVVQTACAGGTRPGVELSLGKLPLARINPFRLIGVFPGPGEVVEWRWDLGELTSVRHGWRLRQWVSSGFDERVAQRVRGANLREALRQRSAGTLPWLRRLHRSHAPQRGPFSTCMHRADAATVSFFEIGVVRQQARIRYFPGPPCRLASRPNRHSHARELTFQAGLRLRQLDPPGAATVARGTASPSSPDGPPPRPGKGSQATLRGSTNRL